MVDTLLSVIVPTHRRPQFLPIAVRSALEGMGNEVEVIVVPNGNDDSWKQSMVAFNADKRVRIESIAEVDANLARNHGMSMARGKYLRFLDDDDYLLPTAAGQLQFAVDSGADICSGLLRTIDGSSKDIGLVRFPETRDFVCAAVSISGFTLPVGNIFLRSQLVDCQWMPRLGRFQDNAWMMDLAARREWKWVHYNEPVGVWYQHDQQRVSSTRPLKERHEKLIEKLLTLHARLTSEERINEDRCAAIAAGLWHYAHRGFPYHPRYWSHVANYALQISAASRPNEPEFHTGFLRHMNPLFAEWSIYPIRRATRLYRDVIARILRNTDYRRQL